MAAWLNRCQLKIRMTLKSLKHSKIKIYSLLMASFISFGAFAGNGSEDGNSTVIVKKIEEVDATQESTATKPLNTSDIQLRFSGFARLIGFYRNMDEYYDVDPVGARRLTLPITIGLNDGSAQPMLMLRAEANFSSRTYFKIHQSFVNYGLLNSTPGESPTKSVIFGEDGRLASIFADGFYFQGNTHTKFGLFELKAGGGSMYKNLSPMTLWTFQYRDDMFERYPWDPAGGNWRRYESYYNTGDIPRDQRWGRRGVQGFILDAYDLPYNLSASVIYGKNQHSGGFDAWLTNIPQNLFAGRVAKDFGVNKIGFNFHNQFGYDTNQRVIDTIPFTGGDGITKQYAVNTNRTGQTTLTFDGLLETKWARIYGEVGAGSYLSRRYFHEDSLSNPQEGQVNNWKRPWSEMYYLEADVNKSLINFPFKISAFRIGKHAVNNSSSILNSSVEEGTAGRDYAIFRDIDNELYFEGMVTEIGQLTNNRQGLNFKTKKQIKNLVIELGLGMQQELENIGADTIQRGYHNDRGGVNSGSGNGVTGGVNNSVTFYHIVNQYQRGRFHYSRRYQGPYGRLQSDFRRAWENIAITDTVIDYKKSFNTLDLTLKYKMKLAKRDLIMSGFFRANSVQDAFSIVPLFSDKAFVRQHFYEFMAFYKLNAKWSLVGFVSTEIAKGNQRTELADADGNLITDVNGKPVYDADGKGIDQVGRGYGIGFDYDFADRASLDVRYRWYTHKDKNFTQDRFSGQDMTIELKIFF